MTIHNGDLNPEDYRPSFQYDPRLRATVCNKCARDVQAGEYCICSPTQRIVTATVRKP